jgi:branched-chain amino acid aminotransferase
VLIRHIYLFNIVRGANLTENTLAAKSGQRTIFVLQAIFMKQAYISYNGTCIPRKDFGISPANRSFRYGDGVFETIRVEDGTMLWASRHYQRLHRSAAILQMILPGSFGPEAMREQVLELYHKNQPDGGAARVRFSLFRSDGGLYTPLSNLAAYIIESEEVPGPGYPFPAEGLQVDIFPDMGKPPGTLSNLKTSSALMFVMASLYKTRESLNDCLILNHHGAIAEATSSNVFLVRGQELQTPGLDQDCVDGVMRSVIMELAKSNGLEVREAPLALGQVEHADELFLTNTINGLSWVQRFRHVSYKNHVAAQLSAILNETVRKEIAKG